MDTKPSPKAIKYKARDHSLNLVSSFVWQAHSQSSWNPQVEVTYEHIRTLHYMLWLILILTWLDLESLVTNFGACLWEHFQAGFTGVVLGTELRASLMLGQALNY